MQQQQNSTSTSSKFSGNRSGSYDKDGDVIVSVSRRNLRQHRNSWPTNGECLTSQKSIRTSQLAALREESKKPTTSSGLVRFPADDTQTSSVSEDLSNGSVESDDWSPTASTGSRQLPVRVVDNKAPCGGARRPSPSSQRRIVASLIHASTSPQSTSPSSSQSALTLLSSASLSQADAEVGGPVSGSPWMYAVARVWYRRWEEHVGRTARGSLVSVTANTAGGSGAAVNKVSEPPGPLEMDLEDDERNQYVNEEIWRRFVTWYGVASSHQLDRRHSIYPDEKVFDVCILSPFSGIVEHRSKRFSRFEQIGYVELQLRRVFNVDKFASNCCRLDDSERLCHRRSRMWISERSSVPRFRQLIHRTKSINDCIQREKTYILALEVAAEPYDRTRLSPQVSGEPEAWHWPTGEPGYPVGRLEQYAPLFCGSIDEGPCAADVNDVKRNYGVGLVAAATIDRKWVEKAERNLQDLMRTVDDQIMQSTEDFLWRTKRSLSEACSLINSRLRMAEVQLTDLDRRLSAAMREEEAVTARESEIAAAWERLRAEREVINLAEDKLREEVEAAAAAVLDADTRVKLNVGGQVYTTSISTLRRCPDSLLGAAFSGRYQLHREPDGSYFIDRDGMLFRHVLNFLRDGRLDREAMLAAMDRSTVRELICEAKYYRLAPLVEQLAELWKQFNSS